MADDQGETIQSGEETVAPPQEAQETPSESTEETEPTGASEGEDDSQESEGLSKRAQERFEKLATERNKATAEAATLRQKLKREEPEADSQQNQQLPPWMNQQNTVGDLPEEVTPEQYRQHIAAEADRIVQLRLQQKDLEQKRVQNFDSDISYLEKEYPELAEDITDKKLLSSLDKAKATFERTLRANPDARLRDFIEPIMEARLGGVEVGRSTASASLAQQQGESAVFPGSQSSRPVSSEQQLIEMLARGEISAKEAQEKYPDLLGS